MPKNAEFLFILCQNGAERALKSEIASRFPHFRFAFSKSGVLTFKIPDSGDDSPEILADTDLGLILGRFSGFSLGMVRGTADSPLNPQEMAKQVWELYGSRPVRRLHVFERTQTLPGSKNYEPFLSRKSLEIRNLLLETAPEQEQLLATEPPALDAAELEAYQPGQPLLPPAVKGEFVLDCILLSDQEWLVGYHRAMALHSRHPGGIVPLAPPPEGEMVSRAWLKLEDALHWSGLPLQKNDLCVELGSAPGGAAQALLARGMQVIGIDPAEMAPEVLENKKFTHIRRRTNHVPRRSYQGGKWLFSDLNVPPSYVFEVVEEMVTKNETQNFKGLLLTLKHSKTSPIEQHPEWIRRVESWGFRDVRIRQLAFDRREVHLTAIR